MTASRQLFRGVQCRQLAGAPDGEFAGELTLSTPTRLSRASGFGKLDLDIYAVAALRNTFTARPPLLCRIYNFPF
jgi:hypothetical protein